MGSQWVQFVASGLTAGAIYALVALGFSIVYNASGAINFAQGEFVMIGGMSAVSFLALGLPLPIAVLLALLAAMFVGLLVEKIAIEPARHAGTVTLIIITIGVSLFLRGLAQLVWDKRVHALPAFSGDAPIHLFGATLLPQSLWVLAGAAAAVAALSWFFGRTLFGKAMLATVVQPAGRAADGREHAHRAVGQLRPGRAARRARRRAHRADHLHLVRQRRHARTQGLCRGDARRPGQLRRRRARRPGARAWSKAWARASSRRPTRM